MESDSDIEVVERSGLLSGQQHAATPTRPEDASPESIGVTPSGPAIWRNFDAHRDSADHYMSRYYEHLSNVDLSEPITNREAAIDAAVPRTQQSRHLNGLKVCADTTIRDLLLMEELLAYIRDVRKDSSKPKPLGIPSVAAAGSLATITASAFLLPAKIATWVALSSVGVAASTVMARWALWPRDINKHYETLQQGIESLRRALEQCDEAEIQKQQHVLKAKTYTHLRSDLMYHWPTPETWE